MPGQAVHPLPTQLPLPRGLENTKADPTQDTMCKQEGAALLQSLSATALPTGSACTEALWRRVSSPSRVGVAAVTKRGRWLVKEEQRLQGRAGRGLLLLPPAGAWAGQSEASSWRLGEAGREEAEGLTLIGGQRRSVAIEVSWDAAAGRARAVTQSLDASLSLKFCKTRRGPGPVSAAWGWGRAHSQRGCLSGGAHLGPFPSFCRGSPHAPRMDRWQLGSQGGSAEEGDAPWAGGLQLAPGCGTP